MDSDRRQLVSEEDSWHTLVKLDGLTGSESESLVLWKFTTFCSSSVINVVNLTDFQEVIDIKCIWSHEHTITRRHEFALWSVSAIKFKLEFLTEVIFDILNVFKFTETQMVDLVREVKSVSLHVKSLNCLWEMMSTDMEVARYLVDENKSRELASPLIFNRFN